MRGVTVCDSFTAEIQPMVRALGRYAEQKKKDGTIHQYRVVNKDGVALLQTKEKRGPSSTLSLSLLYPLPSPLSLQ